MILNKHITYIILIAATKFALAQELSVPNMVTNGQESLCIPIVLEGVDDIFSLQLNVIYDPTMLSWTGHRSQFPWLSIRPHPNDSDGLLSISGQPRRGQCQSIQPQTTITELCFDIAGPNGESTPIIFKRSNDLIEEIVDCDFNIIVPNYSFGLVAISQGSSFHCDSSDVPFPKLYNFDRSFGGLNFPFVYKNDLYLRLDPLGEINTELHRWVGDGNVELIDDLISETQGIFPRAPVLLDSTLYLIGFNQSGATTLYTLSDDSLYVVSPLTSDLDIVSEPYLFENEIYFTALSAETGAELYKLDNNNVIQLVVDLNTGPKSSYLVPKATVGSRLYLNSFTQDFDYLGHFIENGELFSFPIFNDKRIVATYDDYLIVAFDDGSGIGEEPYLFDGQTFQLLADINEGPNSSSFVLDSRPMSSYNTPLREELLFSARTHNYSNEFFIYDGNSLKNVFPYEDESPIYENAPQFWVELGTDLYYTATESNSDLLYEQRCFFPKFEGKQDLTVDSIPTISEWSALLLFLLFCIAGSIVIRNKHETILT